MSISIPLEGRIRLPSKIQEAVQDSGLIALHLLNASRSNELIGSAIKNFSFLDGTLAQSYSNMVKLQQILSSIYSQSSAVENSIEVISDVQEQLHVIERNRYYSAQPTGRKLGDDPEI